MTDQFTPNETPTMLVIDDSVDVHRLLRARLRSEAVELVSAHDGEEGVEIARQTLPALILLDLDMPGLDGFGVLRKLKDNPITVHIPVIVLSGLQTAQDKVMAFDLGAVDYITKPFDLMELRVRVRSALKIHALLQMLAQRAHIDGLSGLWNRAHFDDRWAEEVELTRRHGQSLSLVMMDIDHFKALNDTYGHPAGDTVIAGLAKLLQEEARQTDLPCRYGGEEFAIIMPQTPPDNAENLCDRLRKRLESMTWAAHPERSVTISIGVAGTDGTAALEPEAWFKLADEALYTSKDEGRNRITTTWLPGCSSRLAEAS